MPSFIRTWVTSPPTPITADGHSCPTARCDSGGLMVVAGCAAVGPPPFSSPVSAHLSAPQHIKAFYNATWSQRYGHGLPPGPLTLLYSLTVSIFALGGLVGSLLVGTLVARYGSGLLVLLAGGLMAFSRQLEAPEMVIIGRGVVCVAPSLSTAGVVPLYLGEIAPKNLRGFLGLLPSIFICLGVFCAQVLGLPELLGQVSRMGYHPMGYHPMGYCPVGCPPLGYSPVECSPPAPARPCAALPMTRLHLHSPQDRYWPLFLAVVSIPASLQLLLLHCFPESPRFLLIERNDICGATEGEGCPGWEPPVRVHPPTLP
uniref:Uncharacterized protein n=1 Tax=Pavo cristatus TaxID=9049 RepID=A0A8C9G4C4_PAVCR